MHGESQSTPQGVLRIDAGSAVVRVLVIPALPDFLAQYPRISIDLGVSDREISLINDSADCVIRRGPLADSTLIACRLLTLEWVTCATPEYLARYGTPETPCCLEQNFPLAYYRHARNDRIFPLRFFYQGRTLEIQHSYQLSVNESNAYIAVALSGMAMIQTPRITIQPYLDSGKLVALLEDWQPPAEQLYIVYPSNCHLSAKLRVFIDWAMGHFV